MAIDIDDKHIANATEDDVIEWILFEMGKKRERRRLPEPLDRLDATFTNKPKFLSITSINGKKPKS